jgi:hypothetical protein
MRVNQTDTEMERPIANRWWDWASTSHTVTILDSAGEVVDRRVFAHTEQDLHAMLAAWPATAALLNCPWRSNAPTAWLSTGCSPSATLWSRSTLDKAIGNRLGKHPKIRLLADCPASASSATPNYAPPRSIQENRERWSGTLRYGDLLGNFSVAGGCQNHSWVLMRRVPQ